jgi:hypothetical protein
MWFIDFLKCFDINLSSSIDNNEWIYVPTEKDKETKPNIKIVDGIFFIGLIPEND